MEQWARKLLPFYLLLIFLLTVKGAWWGYQTHHDWMMGDWLINYEGGFIRRGLWGEVLFKLSGWLQFAGLSFVTPGLIHFFALCALFGVFIYYSYRCLAAQRSLLPFTFLIVSPFIYAFQLIDLQGGYRKEILSLALLSYLCYSAKYHTCVQFNQRLWVVLWLFPLLILSHEVLILFLPYPLMLYVLKNQPSLKSLLQRSGLILPSVCAFFVCLWFSGNREQADAILQSLTQSGYPVAGGAVDWFDIDLAEAAGAVWEFVMKRNYVLHYGLALLLAALAFYPIKRNLSIVMTPVFNRLLWAATLLATLILLAVALDWGRFLYVHLVSIYLICLVPERDHAQAVTKPGGYSTAAIASLIAIALLYSQLWYLPHCCESNPMHGALENLNWVTLYELVFFQ